jgi:ComF family protein
MVEETSWVLDGKDLTPEGSSYPRGEPDASHVLHTVSAVDFANALFALTGGGRCAACGRSGSVLCARCAESLRQAEPVRAISGVDRAVAGLEYEGPSRALVLALKLSARREAAEPLVEALWNAVVRNGVRGTVLTWVPARRADVRRRGFDHAELLARSLSRRTGVVARRLLVRRGATLDQASLTAAERQMNLANAFSARPASGRVVLVDDLVTTGSTATACAQALRAAGAIGVELLAACRTP